jgi:hypothetical protein
MRQFVRGAIAGLACALLVFVAGAVTATPSAATTYVPAQVSASNWTLSTSPANDGEVGNVSCANSNFCVLVGSGALIEQWNGTAWSVTQAPTLAGQDLNGVSCSGPLFCMAVGNGTVTQSWNGATWNNVTLPTVPDTTSSVLLSVSCTAPTSCTAVGDSVATGATVPLAEQWNGTSWTVIATPVPTGATVSQLNSVSCPISASCMAVGQSQTAGVKATLAEQWNGTDWAASTTANPSGTINPTLNSVSCAGTAYCVGVGSAHNTTTGLDQTLIETWSNGTWALTTSPNSGTSEPNHLWGVDCFSQTSCTAVGDDGPLSTPVGQAFDWNGSAWSAVATPAPSGATVASLTSVSCLTDWQCVAIGNATVGGTSGPFVISAPIARSGYRFVASDGGVFAEGAAAPFLGSLGGVTLNAPIVGMAVMPAGDGYYLVGADGGVFTFGSAQFYGSAGAIHLNKPIVGMAVTPDGGGYWLVASDGGVFSYGDAQFYGSTGNLVLNKPIVGMAATPDGHGYWLVASDGGVFSFGDAVFQGSTGNLVLNKPVVGMGATTGGGYYLVATDGGIFTFPANGGPPFEGSTGNLVLNKPVVGMAVVSNGYYLGAADGGIFTFPNSGGPPFLGSEGGTVLNAPIVGIGS